MPSTPFLRLKWRLNERAKIHDAYYTIKSIKEIMIEKDSVYEQLLTANRHEDMEKELRLQGRLECLKWLIGSE